MLNVGLVAPVTLDVVQATPPPSHFHGVRVADPAMPAKPCVAGSIPAGGTSVGSRDCSEARPCERDTSSEGRVARRIGIQPDPRAHAPTGLANRRHRPG